MPRDPDMEAVGALMREVGRTAILPRFRALEAHEVMEKGVGDIVTAADLEAEHRLTETLSAMLPGSRVVGEEAHHEDPGIDAHFDGDAPVWVIDPLDGTRNFSNGDETFCMLLALVDRQRTRRAWLYDPAKDRLAMAEEGAGATLNGAPLRTPPPPAESEMIGQINLGWFEKPARGAVKRAAEKRFGGLHRMFCAGHDFLQQAQGLRHFSFYRWLRSWDHAPGVLIRREAGGIVERIDGGPYRAGDRSPGLLSAPDRQCWEALKRFLEEAGPRQG
ncbi:MAG: inositol monophosphatase [Alphaproteobacteria bacterium]|nr:inositol monophosphatase [Alphaproteobacteria bacterium]